VLRSDNLDKIAALQPVSEVTFGSKFVGFEASIMQTDCSRVDSREAECQWCIALIHLSDCMDLHSILL